VSVTVPGGDADADAVAARRRRAASWARVRHVLHAVVASVRFRWRSGDTVPCDFSGDGAAGVSIGRRVVAAAAAAVAADSVELQPLRMALSVIEESPCPSPLQSGQAGRPPLHSADFDLDDDGAAHTVAPV
jgi:hypothetical protein